METPPPKYFRLKPGGEVRLKYAYIIKCDEVVKDDAGNVIELRCTADLESKSGGATSSRKVKGTIHWVSAAHAIDAEVRLYDRLFTVPEPDADGDFKSFINPNSLEVVTAKCEPSLERRGSRGALPVRATGLFRARSGLAAWQAGFQSHDHVERYVGEGSEKAVKFLGLRILRSGNCVRASVSRENSPAFQRWVSMTGKARVPSGTEEPFLLADVPFVP